MMTYRILDALPIPVALLATLLLLLTAYEVGYRWGNWNPHQRGGTTSYIGTAVSAMLALLAFMLGFVFAMASARFDERKAQVLEEANAIGTTWLRARALPAPYPARLVPLLREYLDVRIDVGTRSTQSLFEVPQAIAHSGVLHEQLWVQTIELAREHPTNRVMPLFMTSLNNMIDLHQSRVSVALHFRIAPSVWRTLYFVALLTFLATGFEAGRNGARHPLPVAISLALTLSVVLILIIDLDRPAQHLFKVEAKPLLDLRKSMTHVDHAVP